MSEVAIEKNTYWVGVNDRTTDLFEGLWPIEGIGVSYNSYIIKDEKNVLIDLAKGIKTDDFFNQISRIVDIDKLDYVIVNHMEPDHTGVIKTLRKIARNVEILCSPKAVKMLQDYYGISEDVREVKDGETLSIGSHELQFVHVPFVHWPETMVTFDTTTGVLFSCDAFGGYGAFQGTIFDDECTDLSFYEKESLRYYSNIVAKFSTPVLNAIKKLDGVALKIIAPSHGLVWRKNPARIVDLYKTWAGYSTSGGEKGITLLYGSMYGNTEAVMNAVAQGISDGGIHPEIFDVARVHVSYILPSLWKNNGVVIGAPTYEVSLFPYMQQVLEKAVLKNVKHKKAIYFGSYGWSKGAFKKVQKIAEDLNWEVTEGLEFPGKGTDDIFESGYNLGKRFAQSLK
ncbi:MAG: FprA family A-type flavoprotein [Chitinispirillaceae bacterium]|nr:FprA family A-type flavoprotein [Chitinispirillaceae bacterium]